MESDFRKPFKGNELEHKLYKAGKPDREE